MRLISNEPATPTSRIIRIALDGIPYAYHAGQAASVGVHADQPLTPYSIASAPSDTARDGSLEFLVKVDRANRFGAIVSDLTAGTPVFVTPPVGSFGLTPDAGRVPLLFIAGGTGIAPLRSMLREALHHRHRDRPALVYSARTPEEFAYVEELRGLDNAGQIALTLTLTGDARDWRHARGRAGAEHLAALATPRTMCFICGPPSMVTDLPQALLTLGVPREHIRTEDW